MACGTLHTANTVGARPSRLKHALGRRGILQRELPMKRTSAIKSLGEVALRVNDLQRMKCFYQEVLGLDMLGEFEKAALLKIADGYGGHTQVLGLFDRSVPVDPGRTTVDHIAFTIALRDYDSERRRLESLGLQVEVEHHDWVKWRSLYFLDPEGNQIELVCYDESLGE
jgi:catechol-2,3-dioxygenase